MATNVHLTPELEHFARSCVDTGRYNNVSEVVRASLRLLQGAEDRLQQFQRLLQLAEQESDRDGAIQIDNILPELDRIIASAS